MLKNKIDESKYKWADELKLKFPILCIATKAHDLKFKKTRKWYPLRHQTAGILCHQRFFYIHPLRPRKEVKPKLEELAEKYYDCQHISDLLTLKDANQYSKYLKSNFEVDCNRSFQDLEEAVYPIDCTPENIRKLTSERIPKYLDNFAVFKSPLDRLCGTFGRWNLYILAENSD